MDGVDSTSFLRSDAVDRKTAGNLSFDDGIKLQFGTGDDLRIHHNGSTSYISQAGVGNLVIQNNTDDQDVVIQSDDGSGNTATYFLADGSTGESILYYYGSQKLATKSTGIDVTGLTDTDTLNVSGVSTFQDNIVIGDGSSSTNQKLALNHNIQSNNLVTIRQNAGSNFGDDADVTSINALLNYQGTTSFTSNRTHTGLDLSFNHTNSSGHSSANGQRLSTRGAIIDLDHDEGAYNTQSLIVQNQILKRYTDGSNTQIGINNDVTFNNSSGDASGSTGTHTIFGMDTDISFTGVNDNNVILYGLDTRVQITGAGINTFTSIYGSKVSLSTGSAGTGNDLGISYAYYADYDYDAAGSYDQAYLYYGNYNNSSKNFTNG